MTLARVEQLFALACSTTSDEEDRTAALAGVRLMKKLGLRVAEKSAGPSSSFDDFFGPPRPGWWDAAWSRETPPRPPRPEPRREPAPRSAPNGGQWCIAASEGRCDDCGKRIHRGSKMYVVTVGNPLRGADVQHWCGRH